MLPTRVAGVPVDLEVTGPIRALPADAEAVDAGHADVREDDLVGAGPDLLEPRLPPLGAPLPISTQFARALVVPPPAGFACFPASLVGASIMLMLRPSWRGSDSIVASPSRSSKSRCSSALPLSG